MLITGHSGFKGSWLTLWLVSLGAHVTGLSTGAPTKPSLYEVAGTAAEAESIDGDVRDIAVVERALSRADPEVVIHMAAQSLVRRSFLEPRETYETNVLGTVNVLDAVRRASGVRVVVNVTSDKCYENRGWESSCRECDPMGGQDPYSSSKGCAELVTHAFRCSFLSDPDGARVASARAGNVIGGGDWAEDRLVPDVMRAALGDGRVHIRNPSAIRPWQHVLNPLDGYLVLAEALWQDPEHASAWNFGPAEADVQPVGWVVNRLSELWDGAICVTEDPGPHLPEAQHLRLDSSKARAHLRWQPTWDLERSLKAVIEWYTALRDGEDMRAATLAQIEAFQRVCTRP